MRYSYVDLVNDCKGVGVKDPAKILCAFANHCAIEGKVITVDSFKADFSAFEGATSEFQSVAVARKFWDFISKKFPTKDAVITALADVIAVTPVGRGSDTLSNSAGSGSSEHSERGVAAGAGNSVAVPFLEARDEALVLHKELMASSDFYCLLQLFVNQADLGLEQRAKIIGDQLTIATICVHREMSVPYQNQAQSLVHCFFSAPHDFSGFPPELKTFCEGIKKRCVSLSTLPSSLLEQHFLDLQDLIIGRSSFDRSRLHVVDLTPDSRLKKTLGQLLENRRHEEALSLAP